MELSRRFPKSEEIFRRQMFRFAANLEFETAQNVKERLDILDDYQTKIPFIKSKHR